MDIFEQVVQSDMNIMEQYALGDVVSVTSLYPDSVPPVAYQAPAPSPQKTSVKLEVTKRKRNKVEVEVLSKSGDEVAEFHVKVPVDGMASIQFGGGSNRWATAPTAYTCDDYQMQSHGTYCCGASSFALHYLMRDSERIFKAIGAMIEEWRTDWIEERSYDDDYDCDCDECEARREKKGDPTDPTHMFEVTLTDDQLSFDDSKAAKVLKELGFTLKTRWLNSNTGNICNHFTLVIGNGEEELTNLPFKW